MTNAERDTRERESGPPDRETVNPILNKLAETGVFECEWPTLRSEICTALLAALPQFLRLGPPVSKSRPGVAEGGRVPVTMVRPVRIAGEGEAGEGAEGEVDGRASPQRPWSESSDDDEDTPSTPGGLVIPPFPPLDPNRRKKVTSSPRLNGAGQPQINPYEEDWDEEVVIGGRKLPGWMEEEEARRAVEATAKQIEELSFAPFTVQRLAELVIAPTRQHTTIGKFLRAVEKMLTVTTAYAPPSYVYVAPAPFDLGAGPTSPSSVISEMDADSTVPPASMTPMFSPIPFLAGDELGEPMLDSEGNPGDGLMSPLMLSGDGASNGAFTPQQPQNGSGRSPTPEPEEEADNKTETPNPGNEPYLGRVDELDAGPLAHTNGTDEGEIATGRGEAGNMTPHGMHSRPEPLSSTTVIKDEEREIAPLPARAESVDGGDVVMADAAKTEAAETKTEDKTTSGSPEKSEEKGEEAEKSPAEGMESSETKDSSEAVATKTAETPAEPAAESGVEKEKT